MFLEKANRILHIPILNILSCFALEIACRCKNSEAIVFFWISKCNMQFGEIADMCLIRDKFEAFQNL